MTFLDFIVNFVNLEELVFTSHNFTYNKKNISEGKQQKIILPKLKTLNLLMSTNLDMPLFEFFIANLESLEDLCLYGCNFEQSASGWMQFVAPNLCNLKTLNCSGCNFFWKAEEKFLVDKKHVAFAYTLKSFELSHVAGIDDESLEIISTTFSSSLCELHIFTNFPQFTVADGIVKHVAGKLKLFGVGGS